jgi:glucose-6-phosphate 1-epimerase
LTIATLIENLNRNFGIADIVEFIKGKGDLPCISIHGSFSNAMITLNGGQVLSFIPVGQEHDLLFVSENAFHQVGKATKGGTPICWPWFAAHPQERSLPFHGFVRNRLWQVQSVKQNEQNEPVVTLYLENTDEIRDLWPYAFRLVQVITISDTLTIELQSYNTGTQTFELTQAIHTYFSIGDILQTQVIGLEDTSYLDKVENFHAKTQTGPIRFSGETDRIYQDVSYPLEIQDEKLKRKIIIESSGSTTAVVWNPWIDIAHKSLDLCDDDYKRFVCIETANAANEVISIDPGRYHCLTARYEIHFL